MWFVLLYFSLYWREFLLVGLFSVIPAGLIGALSKNRASEVHDVNSQPQRHQTYCSTPAPRSQSPLPSPNFNNTFTSIFEPHHSQAQGLVERLNGSLKASLRKTISVVSQSASAPPCFTQQSQTGSTFSLTCQLCFWWPCSPTMKIF